ncbi:MAG TPA: hypothetical protein VIS48_07270 [Candidatus Kryptonia bacterium]
MNQGFNLLAIARKLIHLTFAAISTGALVLNCFVGCFLGVSPAPGIGTKVCGTPLSLLGGATHMLPAWHKRLNPPDAFD